MTQENNSELLPQKKSEEFKENQEDFYLENGLVVFTAKYLIKRGYCCHCSCRNCPYTLNNKNSPGTSS